MPRADTGEQGRWLEAWLPTCFVPALLMACLLLAPIAPAQAKPRVVRVGVYQNPPKIFLEDGRISGIFGDLLREIAQRTGWTLKPVPCTWRRCLAQLRTGKIDLMPDVGFSEQRARVFRFGKVPALHSWSEVYRNPKVSLASIRDLQGKRIAVLSGSVQESYLANMIKSFGLRGVRLIPVESLAQGFEMAADGRADATVANNFYGDIDAPAHHLDKTPILFQAIRLFFATGPQGEADLLATIDDYLGPWEADSDSPYYRILDDWKLAPGSGRIPNSIWWGLAGLGSLLALALVAMFLQRRQVQEKARSLRISENKLSVILDNIDAYIYIKDLDLRYQYVNRKVADLHGLPRKNVLGRKDAALFDPETAHRLRADDRRILQLGERATYEEEVPDKDGAITRSFLTIKQPLRDASGQVYALCGISTDFTEQKQDQKEIHRLAFYDSLTGLPNRRLLLDRAEHALANYGRTCSEGALLFVDLDNFKVLNDTLGHSQGDRLLQQVAERLASPIRHNDTLARLGGDEFVLLVENLGGEGDQVTHDVDLLARKVLECLKEPFTLDDRSYGITASVGVAMFSDTTEDVDELLKRADMAMYEAKAGGRDTVRFFNPRMQASLDARATVETDLQTALEQGHLLLHYQPQVDSAGKIFGAEALIRWEHPEKGMIMPGAFIPLAETSGQILSLGRWVLDMACMQLVAWSNNPALRHLTLAVNVSARQFHHPDFVADVLAALDTTGASSHLLELELTESLLADDIETLIEKMRVLKARGVRFSLDDFGTGYSSLSYLKRLPLDQLKIDQSFVRDLLTDPNDESIVKTILALGASLDLAVIAEGVETGAQRDSLIRLGCTRHQGYLFGRPAPADSLGTIATPAAGG